MGPFILQNPQMNVTRLCPGPLTEEPCGSAQGHPGDFDIFVNTLSSGRAEAFIIYSTRHYMSIEKLTPDFLSSTGQNATISGIFNNTVFPEYFVEAPAVFKRGDTWYALYGHCCCFCYQGSGVLVYTAKDPMGPWLPQSGGDIACVPPTSHLAGSDMVSSPAYGLAGTPTPGQGCLYVGGRNVSVTRAQQNFVIEVPTACKEGEEAPCMTYVWTGDRWQQSPDGLKGHEGQFWAPLEFDDQGRIKEMKWIDNFTLHYTDKS